MKAIKRRPLKRLLLMVLPLMMSAGCSNIQSNALYKNWEHRAYNAYRMPVPQHGMSVLPALFKTVASPARQATTQRAVPVHYRQPVLPPARVNQQEEKFIADYYGL